MRVPDKKKSPYRYLREQVAIGRRPITTCRGKSLSGDRFPPADTLPLFGDEQLARTQHSNNCVGRPRRQLFLKSETALDIKKVRRRPTLPPIGSTIGAGGLNFRVRNGNGWNPSAMITGQKHLYGSVTYRLHSESRDRRGNRLPFQRASYPSSTGRVGSNDATLPTSQTRRSALS